MATSVEHPSPPHVDEAVITMMQLALDGLPDDQRTAIRLALVDRLTLSEIADRLGRTPQAVQAAMRDALYTLHDVLNVVDPDNGTGQVGELPDRGDDVQ